MATRTELLAGLLGDCMCTLEAFLVSPNLNLDCLAQATHDAIEGAHNTLQAVKTAFTKSA